MFRIALFFLIGISANAQIHGIVKDSISGQPIPYVNIWVENGNIGATSEQDGSFRIGATQTDKLVFSAVGYQSKTVKTSNTTIVNLQESVRQLDEVQVSVKRPEATKTIEIGGSKEIAHTYLSGATPWIYAKFFPSDSLYAATPFIKNAIVFTKSNIRNATFKLRIFSVSDEGFPENDLIGEDIVVSVKKGWEKNTIDLTKFHLTVPDNGIFIGYEWMIIAKNKYVMKYKNLEGKMEQFDTYAPVVVCNPVDAVNTFHFIGGKWYKKQPSKQGSEDTGKITEPAINLTLTN
ncbi:carboxypeptidase-like regulatory domain-containing protein [Flavobacterium sp.]|uniref:carboxypeptidase-like regulatory domain-containing protein n=1 Tax=Flavobacterium sp. TaxID=239 RepID=UPI002603C249|nr:carboxypeptidase-like regulatory domain-containing protein [Flavobacterium sp.]